MNFDQSLSVCSVDVVLGIAVYKFSFIHALFSFCLKYMCLSPNLCFCIISSFFKNTKRRAMLLVVELVSVYVLYKGVIPLFGSVNGFYVVGMNSGRKWIIAG